MKIAFIALVSAALVALAVVAPPIASEVLAAEESQSIGSLSTRAQDRDGNEPDVTEMVLWTLAAVGVAAVVALIGYVIRQRVGFWLHRPPPHDATAAEEHH